MFDKNKIIPVCDWSILTCLCLVIFFLPFSKAGIESFVWPAIFLWLVKRAAGYRADSFFGLLPKTGLNRALGIFIIFNALSMIFSPYFGLSSRGFFGKELKFIAIFFMIIEIVNSRERLRVILFTIIVSALLITIDAGVQLFWGKDFLREYPLDTFSASFSASSGFAGWLIVIIPLLVGIIFSKVIPDLRLRILLSLIAVIQFLYLLRTFSRGAWLGFAIAICVLFYFFIKNLKFKARLLCLFATVFLLAVFLMIPQSATIKFKDVIREKLHFNQTISERIMTASQFDKGSVSERIMWWKEALEIIKDHPLTGCGLNTYSKIALNYKSFDWGGIYPHNSYLQMIAEIGLFGGAAFFVLLYIFFKICLRHLTGKNGMLVLGLMSGVLAFLIHAFFDTHFYSLQLVILFWFMFGLTIAVINLDPK